MTRMAKGLGGVAAALVVAALALWMGHASAGPEKSRPPSARGPSLVRTAQVKADPLTSHWEGHGVVRAGDRAALAFTVGARLQARPVEVGDQVRKGQLLARLDARAFQHQKRAAQADLERAETQRAQSHLDVERLSKLAAANAVPSEQLERVESALRAARAGEAAAAVQLDEARRALSETVLRAPFDAVVEAVSLEPGEMASPGQPVVVLSGDGAREVEVEVPIDTARRLSTGAAASVRLPLSDDQRELPATVTSVGAASRGRAGLLPVIVALNGSASEAAVAGAAARVRIEMPLPARTNVPVAAVLDPSGSRPTVLRVQDGHIERVPVRIGSLVSERVTVHGPLEPGDQVVVSGIGALQDGDAVRVAP